MDVPERLTVDWMLKHATMRLVGADGKWQITAWRNVVFFKISGRWPASEAQEYVRRISSIPSILEQEYETVYLLFEVGKMKFKPQEATQYIHTEWLKLLEEPSRVIALIDPNPARLQLWKSVHTIAGKRYRIQFFAAPAEALAWVREELLAPRFPVPDRIGEFLVRMKAITPGQVREVLEAQQAGDGRRFGEIAVALGFVQSHAVRSYIEFLEKVQRSN